MADKTIVQLPEITSITEHAVIPIDTGTETFKIKAGTIADYVASVILPAGMMMPYAGTAAPDGWLFATGAEVSRSTYSRLFAAIGTTFGVGNGTTTFNLPDMRGRVAACKDNLGGSAASRLTTGGSGVDGSTLGASGGVQSQTLAGTITGTQSIAHTHNFAHYHAWMNRPSDGLYYSVKTPTTSRTSIGTGSGSDPVIPYAEPTVVQELTDFGDTVLQNVFGSVTQFYTTGVLAAPSGSGSSAVSGAMSANSTVNFSNATFNGATQGNVQPTLVTNYIIRF